jgi:hypothetical protein
MALIEKSRRTANVRAVTYCDFLVLCKRDLDSVLEDCPEIKRSMVTIVHNRKISNSFHSKNQAYSLGHLVSEQMSIKKAKDAMRAADVDVAPAPMPSSHQPTTQLESAGIPTDKFSTKASAGTEISLPFPAPQEQQRHAAPNTSLIATPSGRRVLRPLPLDKPNQ